jgi:hypothetical protein
MVPGTAGQHPKDVPAGAWLRRQKTVAAKNLKEPARCDIVLELVNQNFRPVVCGVQGRRAKPVFPRVGSPPWTDFFLIGLIPNE